MLRTIRNVALWLLTQVPLSSALATWSAHVERYPLLAFGAVALYEALVFAGSHPHAGPRPLIAHARAACLRRRRRSP